MFFNLFVSGIQFQKTRKIERISLGMEVLMSSVNMLLFIVAGFGIVSIARWSTDFP